MAGNDLPLFARERALSKGRTDDSGVGSIGPEHWPRRGGRRLDGELVRGNFAREIELMWTAASFEGIPGARVRDPRCCPDVSDGNGVEDATRRIDRCPLVRRVRPIHGCTGLAGQGVHPIRGSDEHVVPAVTGEWYQYGRSETLRTKKGLSPKQIAVSSPRADVRMVRSLTRCFQIRAAQPGGVDDADIACGVNGSNRR